MSPRHHSSFGQGASEMCSWSSIGIVVHRYVTKEHFIIGFELLDPPCLLHNANLDYCDGGESTQVQLRQRRTLPRSFPYLLMKVQTCNLFLNAQPEGEVGTLHAARRPCPRCQRPCQRRACGFAFFHADFPSEGQFLAALGPKRATASAVPAGCSWRTSSSGRCSPSLISLSLTDNGKVKIVIDAKS